MFAHSLSVLELTALRLVRNFSWSIFQFLSPPVKHHLIQQYQVDQPEGTDDVAPDNVAYPMLSEKDAGGTYENYEDCAEGNGEPPDPAGELHPGKICHKPEENHKEEDMTTWVGVLVDGRDHVIEVHG